MSGNKNQKTKLAKKFCEKIWGGGGQGRKVSKKKALSKKFRNYFGKSCGEKGQKKFKKSQNKFKKISKKSKKIIQFFFKKKFKKSLKSSKKV